MKCNRCGKENPAEIHTCTPKVLVLADQLEDAESARLHLLPYAAAELRHLHEENAALRNALEGVMYWDNGKAEWEIAREALARAGEKT